MTLIDEPFYLPFVEFHTSYDFVIVGIEPVLTTQYEAKLDPKLLKNIRTRKSIILNSTITGLRRVKNVQTNKFLEDESQESEDSSNLTPVSPIKPKIKTSGTLKTPKESEHKRKRSKSNLAISKNAVLPIEESVHEIEDVM